MKTKPATRQYIAICTLTLEPTSKCFKCVYTSRKYSVVCTTEYGFNCVDIGCADHDMQIPYYFNVKLNKIYAHLNKEFSWVIWIDPADVTQRQAQAKLKRYALGHVRKRIAQLDKALICLSSRN